MTRAQRTCKHKNEGGSVNLGIEKPDPGQISHAINIVKPQLAIFHIERSSGNNNSSNKFFIKADEARTKLLLSGNPYLSN